MTQYINLFNPQFRQKKQILGAAFCYAAVLLVLLAGGVLWLIGKQQLRELNTQLQNLQSSRNKLAANAEQASLNHDAEANQQLIKQLAEMNRMLTARQKTLQQFQHDSSTTIFSNYLDGFAAVHVNGVWLTSLTINGGRLALEGEAQSPALVPDYLAALQAEPVFKGRRFAGLQIGGSGAMGSVRFALQNPDGDKEEP